MKKSIFNNGVQPWISTMIEFNIVEWCILTCNKNSILCERVQYFNLFYDEMKIQINSMTISQQFSNYSVPTQRVFNDNQWLFNSNSTKTRQKNSIKNTCGGQPFLTKLQVSNRDFFTAFFHPFYQQASALQSKTLYQIVESYTFVKE